MVTTEPSKLPWEVVSGVESEKEMIQTYPTLV